MNKIRHASTGVLLLAIATVMAIFIACGETVREVEVVKVVEKEVPVEVIKEVAVEKIVKEVVTEFVTETVVEEVEVIKEIPKPVEVKIDKLVIVTPTPGPKVEETWVPTGTFVGVSNETYTMSGYAPDCVYCATMVHLGVQESLFGTKRGDAGELVLDPWAVSSWETASDFSYTDFKARENVPFHRGFGDMDANDIVWYFNSINPLTNPDSRNDTGGQMGGTLLETSVVDDSTARFHWDAFAGHTLFKTFTDLEEGMGIFSKKAYDERGEDWIKDNMIGTGPFQLVEWIEAERVEMDAVTNHWRKTPYVNRVEILFVPENATRRAMLETTQAYAGNLPIKDWQSMFDMGFGLAPESIYTVTQIAMSGNYWEHSHIKTGETLERVRDISKPHVGDPYEGGGTTFDGDTPSMQQSLKVRQALSRTIDRETINDVILGGLGEEHHLGYVWNNDPIWQENADAWSLPYDPDGAKALLTEAGYPDGFDIEWYVGTGDYETQQAVAADWLSKLNVNVTFDRQDYSSWRPTIVARTNSDIFGGCCWGPLLWPFEWTSNTSSFPGGYGIGMELPQSKASFNIKNASQDPAELKIAAVDMLQYLSDWALFPGVVQQPNAAMYNPDVISWQEMRPYLWMRLGGMRSFEYIQLK